MKLLITTAFTLLALPCYADESPSVAQGAKNYDWQTCVEAKSSDCQNSCTTSDDINCSDNCDSMAKDKCLSEGLSPPQ